jgi:hypothetical protein
MRGAQCAPTGLGCAPRKNCFRARRVFDSTVELNALGRPSLRGPPAGFWVGVSLQQLRGQLMNRKFNFEVLDPTTCGVELVHLAVLSIQALDHRQRDIDVARCRSTGHSPRVPRPLLERTFRSRANRLLVGEAPDRALVFPYCPSW